MSQFLPINGWDDYALCDRLTMAVSFWLAPSDDGFTAHSLWQFSNIAPLSEVF